MKKCIMLVLVLFCSGVCCYVHAQCTAGVNFQLIDNANVPSVYSGCTTLTSDSTNKRGCAWSTRGTLDFTTNFSYDFKVNLGTNDANGADGMCFVIQNDPAGLCACGSTGGAMGAGGITKSLIIEIDTYINTEDRDDGLPGITCGGGPDEDHMDMWTNGNVNPNPTGSCPTGGTRYITSAVPLMNGAAYYNIENGLYHLFRVSWNAATKKITAVIMDLAATTTYGTVTSLAITPATLFGTSNPYFGFTASTGGLSNQQSFCLPAQFAFLPIALVDFSAHYNIRGNVEVKWVADNTDNLKYYVLESSADGETWKMCGKENVTNTMQSIYSITDEQPSRPVCYYRLKSVDYNGKTDYSKTIFVNSNADGYDGIVKNVFPLPAMDNLHFTCADLLPDKTPVDISLYDLAGRLVIKNRYDAPIAGYTYELDVKQLPTGLYQAVFSQGAMKQVNKISVVK